MYLAWLLSHSLHSRAFLRIQELRRGQTGETSTSKTICGYDHNGHSVWVIILSEPKLLCLVFKFRGDHVDIICKKLPTSGGDKVVAVWCLFCVKLGHSEYLIISTSTSTQHKINQHISLHIIWLSSPRPKSKKCMYLSEKKIFWLQNVVRRRDKTRTAPKLTWADWEFQSS